MIIDKLFRKNDRFQSYWSSGGQQDVIAMNHACVQVQWKKLFCDVFYENLTVQWREIFTVYGISLLLKSWKWEE